MLVRLRMKKDGAIEDVHPVRAKLLLKLGHAEAILHAENQGGPAACAGIELALREPKSQKAVLSYARTVGRR